MSKPHNIFISWSGQRSNFLAEALNEWLPHVLQSARPWLSTRDIDKGTRSLSEMNKALGMGFGISCLTAENLKAPWILYEAGALSKTFDDDKARLWTYLIELEAKDIEPPLGQFQHTKADKEDTRKLIHSINVAIHREEERLEKELVDKTFDRWWPELDNKIKLLPQPEKTVKTQRNSDEILSEILGLCRQYLPQIESLDTGIIRQDSLTGLPTGTTTLASLSGNVPFRGLNPFNPPPKRTFYVKLADDDEIKKISGTKAFDTQPGLVIVDGDDVVAKFTDSVQQWWQT